MHRLPQQISPSGQVETQEIESGSHRSQAAQWRQRAPAPPPQQTAVPPNAAQVSTQEPLMQVSHGRQRSMQIPLQHCCPWGHSVTTMPNARLQRSQAEIVLHELPQHSSPPSQALTHSPLSQRWQGQQRLRQYPSSQRVQSEVGHRSRHWPSGPHSPHLPQADRQVLPTHSSHGSRHGRHSPFSHRSQGPWHVDEQLPSAWHSPHGWQVSTQVPVSLSQR
ncbi:MAG: hypothetical protein QOF01_1816 [Thermomicrobiales bacterium]|nr:hypothetical protein [Thermomicrobiales bacterium]MEA2595347.1 hypothetical protein [Thermomicrobiales bacterium]